MTESRFVYGTLCPGRPNQHLLKNIGGTFAKASVRSSLHNEGWSATMGYPAIRLNETAGNVQGFVFSAKNLSEHWPVLDEFEGEAYQRVKVDATLTNGRQIETWVYSLNPTIKA